ncbi:MAG TPA: extradiol dioxygenase [Vicinamibacteria bacterium]|nr:extradiol dioxygenase [Vicinamibacteria bacterium]
MIVGAHSIIYSRSAEADRAFLRDVLGLPHADAGDGWLVFGLPPAEVAVHPEQENDVYGFYLMSDDVHAFVADMAKRGVACTPPRGLGWGILTEVSLPGGGRLGVYEPRHARPTVPKRARSRRARPTRRSKAGPRVPGRKGRGGRRTRR